MAVHPGRLAAVLDSQRSGGEVVSKREIEQKLAESRRSPQDVEHNQQDGQGRMRGRMSERKGAGRCPRLPRC